ncbi:MAG TPA: GNAT family N-acetyltransferase [Bryobacteraceae bacterium]|nr:GNAT family N-acetyltransferase [Bryobacteraceae bacterium]
MTVRALTPADWPVVEELFGANGACGGCWCMWWRVPHGGKLWEESKGEKNRRALKSAIEAGEVHAVIAFDGESAVGWCSFGPRETFPRIQSVKALRGEAPPGTWSIVCFYIRAKWRRKGVAGALLDAATRRAFELGAQRVEGYPVIPSKPEPVPAVFAWTGIPRLFESAGFRHVAGRTYVRTK